jgi:protein ImuA
MAVQDGVSTVAKALDPLGLREQNTNMNSPLTLETLRQRVRMLERPAARHNDILPFGVPAIDLHLPEHGLPRAALHEIGGGGADAGPGACAALFVAGILARMEGAVFWCAERPDVFAPGLACAGLAPDRVLYAEVGDEKTVLLVMEEALRHSGLCAVVGEVARLPMTASRRLVLAAEKSGVMAIALRRRAAADDAPNAARTRWRIGPYPSAPLPVPGIGRGCWQVELTRCRGGTACSWIMEACDAQGCLAVSAELGDGSGAAARRAS